MPAPSPPVRGDIAQALRLARGHTLRDVTGGTGVHTASLSLIEHGHRPGKPHLHTLAAFLHVDPDVLAGHRPALRALRDATGIAADVLAEQVGITAGHLARIEAGEEFPDPFLTRRLARRLGVKPSTLSWTPADEAAA